MVDVAAEYCEWINNIDAKEKYAVDMNPGTANFAAKDVKVVVGGIDALSDKKDYFDCVFMSNFLEHLNSKEEVQSVLSSAWDLLRDGGRLMILQPNIKYVGGKYWDFIDHKTPLTEQSLTEAVYIIRTDKQTGLPSLSKNFCRIQQKAHCLNRRGLSDCICSLCRLAAGSSVSRVL